MRLERPTLRLGKEFPLVVCVLSAATVYGESIPIPEGFDFPAEENKLLAFRDANDVPAMRRHAWMVFAGMTQKAPGGEAIWETWHPSDQTFSPGALPQDTGRQRPRFRPPRQFTEFAVAGQPQAIGASLLASVMFNPEGHRFIRENKLYLQETMNAARATNARDIKDAPPKAVSLKIVWWPIKSDGLSALPVWDGTPTKPVGSGLTSPRTASTVGNDFPSWRRVVAVDPNDTIPAGGTATVKFFNPEAANPEQSPVIDRRDCQVVSLNRFYSFQLTQDDVNNSKAELNGVFRTLYGRDVRAGDYVAMVCFHFTTKEIDDWVWATLWWHDNPDDGPFAKDRTPEVAGVWQNYLMDVAYSMDTPKEADGSAKVAFNPWLEARFANGMLSNCMTCHQRAVWPPVDFLPVTRGSMRPDNPFFNNRTRLDFLWSVAFESKESP